MSYKPKYFGVAEELNGKMRYRMDPYSQIEYDKFMGKMKDGQDMEMTMAKKFKPRTTGAAGEETNFNGYLFGVAYKIIGDTIGEWDTDYIHLWVQKKVLNLKKMPDGDVVVAGTSHMSGGEFAEYCKKVRMWAGTPGNINAEGIFIPEPNEVDHE